MSHTQDRVTPRHLLQVRPEVEQVYVPRHSFGRLPGLMVAASRNTEYPEAQYLSDLKVSERAAAIFDSGRLSHRLQTIVMQTTVMINLRLGWRSSKEIPSIVAGPEGDTATGPIIVPPRQALHSGAIIGIPIPNTGREPLKVQDVYEEPQCLAETDIGRIHDSLGCLARYEPEAANLLRRFPNFALNLPIMPISDVNLPPYADVH